MHAVQFVHHLVQNHQTRLNATQQLSTKTSSARARGGVLLIGRWESRREGVSIGTLSSLDQPSIHVEVKEEGKAALKVLPASCACEESSETAAGSESHNSSHQPCLFLVLPTSHSSMHIAHQSHHSSHDVTFSFLFLLLPRICQCLSSHLTSFT